MSKLSFIIIIEVMISITLGLSGIQPALFSFIAGTLGANSAAAIPNITSSFNGTSLNQSTVVTNAYGFGICSTPPVSSSTCVAFNVPTSVILFGIFGITIILASLIGLAAGFSVIFMIPAFIAVSLLWIFSPITTITNVMIGDPVFWPFGILFEVFFLGLTILGFFDFITGREL